MKFYKNIGLIFIMTHPFVLVAAEAPMPIHVEKLTPIDSVLPMLSGLLAVVFVIFLLAFLFKKLTNFSPNSQNIKVLETQVIGHKEKLMIVKVKEQQFLIGVTSHSINQLGKLDTTINIQEHQQTNIDKNSTKTKTSFTKILSNLINPAQIKSNSAAYSRAESTASENTIKSI